MKTKATCNTCIDREGRPDSKCEVRDTCPDDGSTTEKRTQTITPYPKMEATILA